ncbi:MAG: hypothetical protein LUH14_02360 [Clostridiaceae bacterium]|nr:hypothetical protein [Clostridiaceae bacterium]
MQEMEQLISALTLLIQEQKKNPQSKAIREYGLQVAKWYFMIQEKGLDLFGWLDREFANDTDLYLLILSWLFTLFKEQAFLNKAEKLLYKDDLSWDYTAGIRNQINRERFCNLEMDIPYFDKRMLWSHLRMRFQRETGCQLSYVPYEQRNHKRILLCTDTLLGDLHAPTRVVLEAYKILRYELGYEVMLLVHVENIPVDLSACWLNPMYPNYYQGYQHHFTRLYKEQYRVDGYQQIINESTFSELPAYFQMLREWNPECALHIGAPSVTTDLLREMTTVLSMPCTSGYAVSDAQLLVGYLINDTVPEVPEMRSYLEGHGQKWYDIRFAIKLQSGGKVYQPEDFGFAKEDFIIAVVGNRLDNEIDSNFRRLMEEIAKQEERVRYLLIGACSLDFEEGILKGRVNQYGFCQDLVDVLKGTDLFLNPKRQGGGGGAARAIAADVPVISLPDCDVAECVGSAFLCESYGQIPELVSRYCRDGSFYRTQQEECAKAYAKRQGIDNTEEFRSLIIQAEQWMQEGVVS